MRSDEVPVLSGVPQGTILGPLMLLLYVIDLPSRVHNVTHCRLFADDCLLYRVVESIDNRVQLQADLNELQTWANECSMRFNPSECPLLTVNKCFSHRHPYWTREGSQMATKVVVVVLVVTTFRKMPQAFLIHSAL